MLTGYYISGKDNENIIKASLVIKGESKPISPLFICLQEPLVISKSVQLFVQSRVETL